MKKVQLNWKDDILQVNLKRIISLVNYIKMVLDTQWTVFLVH